MLNKYFPVLLLTVILSAGCDGGSGGSKVVWDEGPSGRPGGDRCGLTPKAFTDPGRGQANLRLVEVQSRSGDWIDAVDLKYISSDAVEPIWIHCGGDGGSPNEPLVLDSDEVIVEVQGAIGSFVDRLMIRTNKNRVRTWGSNRGTLFGFTYQAPEGMAIASLYFSSATYIDRIGVLLGKR